MSEQSAPAAAPAAAESAPASAESSESNNDVELLDEGDAAPAAALDLDEEEIELLVDGKTIKEKINWKDKDALRKKLKEEFQKAKAFNSKSQKAAAEEKRANQAEKDMVELINYIKKNPKAVLRDPNIGVDLKAFAEEVIAEELEKASKSPEQLEQERIKEENETLKRMLQEKEQAREAEEMAKLELEVATKVQGEILGAIKAGGLTDEPESIKLVAQALKLANKYKVNVTAADVIPLVKDQIAGQVRKYTSLMKEDELESLLGQDRIKQMYKSYVAKTKAAKAPVPPTAASIQQTGTEDISNLFNKKSTQSERMTGKQFIKNLEKTYSK